MKQTLTTILLGVPLVLAAQNPVIRDQFSADPTARVFNNKVYIYPSHDIDAPDGHERLKEWFCMADYHVFSSENLTDWTDHGVTDVVIGYLFHLSFFYSTQALSLHTVTESASWVSHL